MKNKPHLTTTYEIYWSLSLPNSRVARGDARETDRHGEDFNADIDNQYSYSRVGLWCAKTAWAYWRQALMVEFVNNREKVISEAVAKAVDRSGDGVHNAWQHGM